MGAKGVHADEFARFFSDLDVDQSGDADADAGGDEGDSDS